MGMNRALLEALHGHDHPNDTMTQRATRSRQVDHRPATALLRSIDGLAETILREPSELLLEQGEVFGGLPSRRDEPYRKPAQAVPAPAPGALPRLAARP